MIPTRIPWFIPQSPRFTGSNGSAMNSGKIACLCLTDPGVGASLTGEQAARKPITAVINTNHEKAVGEVVGLDFMRSGAVSYPITVLCEN